MLSGNSSKSIKIKKHVGNILFNILRYFMLTVIGYIVIYPLLFMIVTSIKSELGMMDWINVWLPKYVTFDYFKQAFEILKFPSALKRTLTLQVVSAFIEVFICSMIGYGFARFNFYGKKIALVFLIVSLLIPTQLYSLSLSLNFRHLDLVGILGLFNKISGIDLRPSIYNTNFTFWLPSIFGVGIRSGMIIYIYNQFYTALPYELEEAAYIDGAGLYKTYFKIVLPSASVVMVTTSVLSVIWFWNESFLSSLCFLNDDWPLSVAMYNLPETMAQYGIFSVSIKGGYTNIVFAACLMFIVIPLISYLIIQRKFVKSIDRVGITG